MHDGRQDLAYWRDVAFIGLGVLSVVAGIGHVLDWHAAHQTKDIQTAIGFLLLLPLLFALSPRRIELLLGILFAITLFGVVGTILKRSLAGLSLMIPCGILTYIILKWKGQDLARTKDPR
jgi:hypothetical protein